MDIHTINSTSVLSRCMRFIGVPLFAGLAVALMMPAVAFSQTTVNLGTASSFAVLAAAGITNTGNTALTGDIGSYPTNTITGFPPGTFTGTNHGGDATTQGAMVDLKTAYNDAAGRTGATTVATELGGTTLTAGVYNSAAGTFGITGTLTLSGTASAVFIFQMSTTFTTAASSSVILSGGVVWTNVFWQVGSSATLGASSVLEGTILANTSISSGDGAQVHGRLLAGAVTSSGAVTLINNTALPVELTSFTVALNKSAVELNWNTATEVNNYGFEIERLAISDKLLANSQKLNANSWSKIGFVQGHGNSNSPKEYSFEDKNPQVGKLQYRLKQIDFDGAFEYSNVAEVEVEAPKQFTVYQNYPNPFNPTTNISYEIPVKSNVVIKVYDVLGSEVVALLNEEKLPGRYQVEFKASHLPSGIYFYSINAGEYKSIKKMIVLK